jgi:four helix bundle protein
MTNRIPYRERFPHRKLEVYHVACEFYVMSWKLCDERIEYRDSFVRLQLLRAAQSIKLNISEAAIEYKPKEKARMYRLARRSACECAAILDDFPQTIGVSEADLEPYYKLLTRISNMLTKLCRTMEAEDQKGKRAR